MNHNKAMNVASMVLLTLGALLFGAVAYGCRNQSDKYAMCVCLILSGICGLILITMISYIGAYRYFEYQEKQVKEGSWKPKYLMYNIRTDTYAPVEERELEKLNLEPVIRMIPVGVTWFRASLLVIASILGTLVVYGGLPFKIIWVGW